MLDSDYKTDDQSTYTNETENDSLNKLDFNPYIGVGSDSLNYSIDDIFANVDEEKLRQQFSPNSSGGSDLSKKLLDTIASNPALLNIMNVDTIKTSLKNMNKEDIDNGTNYIQDMLGLDNISDDIKQVLFSATQTLSNELDNTQKTSNPMEDLFKAAINATTSMKQQIENKNIDMSQLTGALQKKMTENNINPELFESFSGKNPMAILQLLLSKAINKKLKIKNN
jgi:hypothetical protein